MRTVFLILVNGELVWVAPLEHEDVFKCNANRSTPGYITVSASNPNKVDFVTKLSEDYIDIVYQQSAFFGNDLNKTFWGNGETTGVVLVDAQDGEIEWYSVDDTPDWVDVIQPEEK